MKFRRITLNINGADRSVVCDPEKDTLAAVLRRIGLTGVKVGCGIGVCGACNVILNGKLIRSCTKKIASVEEGSTILTIEGIGSPLRLHPLQEAFLSLGAVQCGFCSPGFIVSAYALLQENPAPTREEVRAWFRKNRNACRCTGYKQIVDAVMAAAAVMRGEKSIEEIRFQTPENSEYYGKPVPRPAALAKVCGVADYGDDIALKMPEGTLHAVMVMPRVGRHVKINSIDVSAAEGAPGVVKVVTAKDVEGTNRYPCGPIRGRSTTVGSVREVFGTERIGRRGDVIGAVIADTEEHARQAAALVKMDYEKLPEYRSVPEVAMPGAMEIHEGTPNLINLQPKLKGVGDKDPAGVVKVIDDSAFSVEGSFYSTPQPHLTIEGDVVESYWDEDDRLTILCKSQNVYGNAGAVSTAVGLPLEKVRVILNPTGGSFGWAINPGSYAVAAVCTMATGAPVVLHQTYEEFMYYSGKRSACYTNARLGCDADGKITGALVDFAVDHGAYRESDYILERVCRFFYFNYTVPNVALLGRIYNTNNNYGTAYRGFGAPQAYTAGEAMMDMLAEKAGIDPFEFRWRNIAREGDTNISSMPYRTYPMEELMTKMRPYYDRAVAEAKAADTPELRRGVGLAFGGYCVSTHNFDNCTVRLQLNPDGSVTKYDTWEDVGQGGDIGSLMVTLEALKPLGLTEKDIHLVQSDTKICPDSGAAASSRSHFMNSNATKKTADALLAAMRKPDGTYRTYDEMKAEGIPTEYQETFANQALEGMVPVDPNTGHGDNNPVYNHMLFLAEVEVETATGRTRVLRYTCVDDVGVVGNIDALNGQAYSGMAHGIGFALSENYDDDGKHTNIASCGFPYIDQVPDDATFIHCENPRKENVFGSAGCAEGFQSSPHVAVINAIANATGVRIYEMPATPAKVKAGLDALAEGKAPAAPGPYFLGSDLIEELEEIVANPV